MKATDLFSTKLGQAVLAAGGDATKVKAVLLAQLKETPTERLEVMQTVLDGIAAAKPDNIWINWARGEIAGIIFDRTLVDLAEGLGIGDEIKELLNL